MPATDENVARFREGLRKDLDSVSLLPTGMMLQLVAGDDATLGFTLMCEGVWVRLANGRDVEDADAYLAGPMGVKDAKMRRYILSSAMRTHGALARNGGDARRAIAEMMGDKGAERDVVESLVEACARVMREFDVPWGRPLGGLDEDDDGPRPDGEIVNDSFATNAPHVRASLRRLYGHDPMYRMLINGAIRRLLTTTVLAGIVVALFATGHWVWGAVLSVVLLVVGARMLSYLGLVVLFSKRMRQFFHSALLTPGMIVRTTPLTVACLAEMSNGDGSRWWGLRLERWESLGMPAKKGEIVPCVSTFSPGDHEDRWDDFTPKPIAWGTADPSEWERTRAKLDAEEVAVLRRCVQGQLLPADPGTLVVLDEQLRRA